MTRIGLVSLFALVTSLNAEAAFRLVTKQQHDRYMRMLPQGDTWFLKTLKDRPIIFYDDKVMPPAYQHSGGVHDVRYNISAAKPQERYGNANREFPWGKPGGLHHAKNAGGFKFLILPAGQAIRYQRKDPGDGEGAVYSWAFPTETVFGDVLTIRHKGREYPFELRTRTKRPDGKWAVNVYRPIASLEELADKADVKLALGRKTRLRNRHRIRTFNSRARQVYVGKLPEQTVRELLSGPFKSVLGKQFAQGCNAPSTLEAFNIVPKGYLGSHVEASQKSCMQCHETSLMTAARLQSPRDWYGRVRGCGKDGILSFHIFDRRCINSSGFTTAPVLSSKMRAAGILKSKPHRPSRRSGSRRAASPRSFNSRY